MKTFRDKLSNPWDIDVNGETIARVKSLTGFLLTDLITPEGAIGLSEDPVRFMSILFACCKSQAESRGIDEAAFRKGLDGDAIDAATTAVIDEVVDFFPKSRRAMSRLLVDKTKAITEEATRRVILELERMDPSEVLAKLLAKQHGNNSGNSPESSALTPPASPSEASA